MTSRARIAGVVAVLFILSACGSSGGGGNGVPAESACSGSACTRDDLPAAPLVCGGAEQASCPQGYRCVADPARACAIGQDCPGACVLGEDLPTCGGFAGQPCPDGFVCSDDFEDACAGGPEVDCPGICRPAADGDCGSDADCPQLEARCEVCADGSLSCARSVCKSGECTVDLEPCATAPECGGFAGIACAPGFVCIDDPTDDCDPRNGGADCGGLCVPAEGPRRCGGEDVCPPGYVCVGLDGQGCEPNDSGTDCAGVCRPEATGECASDDDCAALRAPCFVCPDGKELCPRSFCDHGRCNAVVPACGTPVGCGDDAGCAPGEICVAVANDGCDPATGVACEGTCVREPGPDPRACGGFAGDTCPPGYECIDDRSDDCVPGEAGADCPGVCTPVAPEPCSSDAECPHILAPCHLCPDGSYACPRSECRNGACATYIDACKPGFCGGFPGFTCPPGSTCIDDLTDDCDPRSGGADCPGVCVREEEPRRCGGFAGDTCPPGLECVDDVRDDCDPEDGGADCPGVCRPAAGGACHSDSDCAVIAACLICPDGTAACPRPFCVNGTCTAEFPDCGEA